MTTLPDGPSSQASVNAWLNKTFPLRNVLRAEIGSDLRDRPLLPVDLADKSFFGDLMEHAIGLVLCDQPPYPHLVSRLPYRRATRLLGMAGYQPPVATATDLHAWRRSDIAPDPARLFIAAYRLVRVHGLLNPKYQPRPDPDVVARIIRGCPNVLHDYTNEMRCEWLAFADLWINFTNGFHAALRSYGPAVAHVALLGGLRHADFVLGTTEPFRATVWLLAVAARVSGRTETRLMAAAAQKGAETPIRRWPLTVNFIRVLRRR